MCFGASGAPDIMPRLSQYASAWALAPFALLLVGRIGTVPIHQCQIPLGIKIPATLAALAPELWQGRYLVAQAFGFNLFTPFGTMRTHQAQPWPGEHPMGFTIYRWMLWWHPMAGSPLLPLDDVPGALRPVHAICHHTVFLPHISLLLAGPWRNGARY